MTRPIRRKTVVSLVMSVIGIGIALGVTGYIKANASDGIDTAMVADQEGSPVRLISTTSTLDGLFMVVTVQNKSQKTIDRIAFGSLIHNKVNPKATPIFVAGSSLNAPIASGATGRLEARLVPFDTVKQALTRFPNGATAELGVLLVTFTDGTKYSFDAKARGYFGARKP